MLGNFGWQPASVGKLNWTMGLRYSSMSKAKCQHQPWLSKPQMCQSVGGEPHNHTGPTTC